MTDSERRKVRYAAMTDEQRQARKNYQKIWMAKHRAELKASRTAGDPSNVQSTALPVRQGKVAPAPSSVSSEASQTTKPAKSGKPKGAVSQHRAWRAEIRDQLLDFLTSGQCSLSGEDFQSNRSYGLWFGVFDKLTSIERVADNEDQLAELRLSVAIECLRRLSGETPAGCAPALPARTAL
jgi:hypothetical protein